MMHQQDFSTTFLTDKSPKEAFHAINNVRGWWSEEIEGNTDKPGEAFHYHYKDEHSCTMKLTEFIPEKKVIWTVLDNHFNFTKDKSEWIGTQVIFELSEQGDKTQIKFTHQGLVPDYECFEVCKQAWTTYIQDSLKDLINTGKGQPNPKEAG